MPTKSNNKKNITARPPVDALQYEKLALSAFDLCHRQMRQLETLTTLASTLCRNPPITIDERHRHRTLLELLAHTGEEYQQQLATDLELFGVIALDAKGVANKELTAKQAAHLLANATEIATRPSAAIKTTPRKRSSAKCVSIVKKDRTHRSVAVQH
ncbi:hypothetical protein [Paraburkholderia sp. BL21I4N1]|uniref:hypothetical protein n=1 Tax=Paraburkholderia sp. BL21I4N1 TaxID=1938801 RepID=UPI000CFB899D|nr:hypothetical protein [Paraburkholderia sp. BL21I4N1]PQV54619.1 hypothetical protein B0G83_101801 [Paraburkholderia sp. BL21I4N1]